VHSAPDSRLRGLVAGRCGYRERAQASVRRRLPATSLIPVILSFGERLEVDELADGHGAGRSYESFVAGYQPGHALTRFTGSQFALQVYLTPVGVYRILGIPGSALSWGVHDLEDIAPNLASLPDQLASLPTWLSGSRSSMRCLSAWPIADRSRTRWWIGSGSGYRPQAVKRGFQTWSPDQVGATATSSPASATRSARRPRWPPASSGLNGQRLLSPQRSPAWPRWRSPTAMPTRAT
jgi:hypothetical protein